MKSMTPEEVLEHLPDSYVCIAMNPDRKWNAFRSLPIKKPYGWEIEDCVPTSKPIIMNISYGNYWEKSLTVRKLTFADLEIGEEFQCSDYDCSFIKINETKIVERIHVMNLNGDKEVTRV